MVISKGMAGNVPAGLRRRFPGLGAGWAAGWAAGWTLGMMLTTKFPLRPGFTLAASQLNTISTPPAAV